MKTLYSVIRTMLLAAIFTYGILYAKFALEAPSGEDRPQMASVANG